MTYLIDTSCLIDCKNDYYPFVFCPAFWDWLEQQNENWNVFSVEQCCEELKKGQDELAAWAKRLEATFFLKPDDAVMFCMSEVTEHVESLSHERHIKDRFMGSGDPLLVAHALAYKYTIVTHESRDKNQLKIPSICTLLNIKYATIFDAIRDSKAQFILRNNNRRRE